MSWIKSIWVRRGEAALVTAVQGVSAGRDIRDSDIRIINQGDKAALKAINARMDTLVRALSAEEGVPLPVLQGIMAAFGEYNVALDPAEIEQRLRAKADEYRELRERLTKLTDDDPRVRALRGAATELIDRGEFGVADARFAEAERLDLAAVGELESVARVRRVSAAANRAARADAARLRLDYRTAAEHFATAASIVADDSAAIWNYQLRQGKALYDRGSEFGDNPALAEAIAVYSEALGLAPRERVPLDWAMTQNNLGNALSSLGERERGTVRLEEAVAAYRAALTERTRERVPLAWAMTQNNLGAALRSLGERESGTARLAEAVAAYRAALMERTRERVPLAWATTKNNLGNALRTLGERKNSVPTLIAAQDALDSARALFRAAGISLYEESITQALNRLANLIARLK